jgi:hypothetical protein
MKKKLDLFNFFYSLGAVIILLGVIAKLLEWEGQDILMTVGLSMEIFIFALSAVKFVPKNDIVQDNINDMPTNFPPMDQPNTGTYINIQNGVDPNLSQADINLNNYKSYLNTTDTFSIDLNVDQFGNLNLLSNLSQLDKIVALSQVKDLLYHPDWYQLNTDDYNKLIVLVKNIFGMRMPNFEFLPILIQTPVKLPVPDFESYTILDPVELTVGEIEILCKAFALVNDYNFLDHFVFQEVEESFYLRMKHENEIQIFGGEQEDCITHIKRYLEVDFVISPNIKAIKDLVFLYDIGLLEELILVSTYENKDEFISLTNIVSASNDKIRTKHFQKNAPFLFLNNDEVSLQYLLCYIQLALSFDDKTKGRQLFEDIISFKNDFGDTFVINDIINYNNDAIYFGINNEYTILLKDLFSLQQLKNLNYINLVIEQVLSAGGTSKAHLDELFGLQINDFKTEIHNKLNDYLAKAKMTPNGSQLAFILLYKQYNS